MPGYELFERPLYRPIIEVEKLDMRTNAKETKVMRINSEGDGTPLDVNVGGLQQEEGNEFCFRTDSVRARSCCRHLSVRPCVCPSNA